MYIFGIKSKRFFESFLVILLFSSLLTGCLSTSTNESDQVELEDQATVYNNNKAILGTYRGMIYGTDNGAEPAPFEIKIFFSEEPDGENSVGEVRSKLKLIASYRRLDMSIGIVDPILAVKFYKSNGGFLMFSQKVIRGTQNIGFTTFSGVMKGDEVVGNLKASTGVIGRFKMARISD